LSQIFLASASPRRAALLKLIGVPFHVVPSDFEEPPPTRWDNSGPAPYVMRLAREKAAHAVLPDQRDDKKYAGKKLVLAADTIVWHEGEILGKPRDENHAREMLQRLSGASHQVFTGVCLREIENGRDEFHVAHQTTNVQFRPLNVAWISRYVATGEPLDKAGAYAAQGRGAAMIESIGGDFWNVVGLPLATLGRLLETVGAPLEEWWIK